MTMAAKTIRIGGGAAFWGDTETGPEQLVRRGKVDYLVLDYLAEITMAILVRARAKSPELGYARDFVTMVMAGLIEEIAAQRGAARDERAGNGQRRAAARGAHQH